VKNYFGAIRSLLALAGSVRWALPGIVVLCCLASAAEGFGISLFIPFLQTLDRTEILASTGNALVDRLVQVFYQIPAQQRLAVIAGGIFACV
jgi:subfamily B ATP-binding cassette protein MsbA